MAVGKSLEVWPGWHRWVTGALLLEEVMVTIVLMAPAWLVLKRGGSLYKEQA